MHLKELIIMCIFLLVIVTISAVSAEDNATLNDSIIENDNENIFGTIAADDSLELREYLESAPAHSSSDYEMVKANYSEDENSDSMKSVELKNFTITFYDDYHIYGETNIFGFLMPKDIKNNVSVLIDGKSYGYNVYNIDNPYDWVWGGDSKTQMGYMVFFDLSSGNHEVIISYPGDSYYAESCLVKNIKVHEGFDDDYKTITELTASNLNTYYNSGKSFVATLTDENRNPIKNVKIKIKFNGKNKSLETDDNGQIRLTTNNLIPKSYDVTITFLGNDYFTKSTAKAKIIVKKAIPKITASKKTFKKSLKTKKYTITLKANNKALKNTKVYLKIKGKTYTAKTNKYGKATFKITKLVKKGTFKATIKYVGSKYYSAKTINTKIKCK